LANLNLDLNFAIGGCFVNRTEGVAVILKFCKTENLRVNKQMEQ